MGNDRIMMQVLVVPLTRSVLFCEWTVVRRYYSQLRPAPFGQEQFHVLTALHGTEVNTFYVALAVNILGIPVLQEFIHIWLGRCIISILELLVIANKIETASIYPQRLRVYNRINDEILLRNLKKNYHHKETLSIHKPSLYLKRLTYSGPFIYVKSVFCHHCCVASFWLFGHSDGKESACNVKDLGSIPGLGRSLDKGMVPTPVFLPEESHGQRRLENYSPWGRKESDTTERLILFEHLESYWNCWAPVT